MTQSLDDLYKEIILDHYRRPRNRGSLEPPARSARGYNPLCGDEITVWVDEDAGTVTEVRIEGKGCAISQSSASMMSQLLTGKSVAEAHALVRRFKSMLNVEEVSDEETFDDDAEAGRQLGDAESLRSVRQFPARIKCATLGWNAFEQAVAGVGGDVTTET